MKIKTITCHDVYNLGASLQAYALLHYLREQGYDTEIIDYKPIYLRHYRLSGVPNPAYNRPFLRQAYQIAKFPFRLYERLTSKRKKAFDLFTKQYLPLTEKTYPDFAALQSAPPEADVYIAGSDQIWNPLFNNGKDPAFFLDFVPEGKKRLSYAASFAVDSLSESDKAFMQPKLSKFDSVSVRESSGVSLVADMGLNATQVMDPVFLLNRTHWETLAVKPSETDYILVYDFDKSPLVKSIALKLKEQTGKKIISVFPLDYADEIWQEMGPQEFLGSIVNSATVISNSFHATAFSLIFQKNFFVANREEKINTRMRDLLHSVGLGERLITKADALDNEEIDWNQCGLLLGLSINKSKDFLAENL